MASYGLSVNTYGMITKNDMLRLNYMSTQVEIKGGSLYIDKLSAVHLGNGRLTAATHANRIEIYNTTSSAP